jgi:hypothetical protein
MVESEDEKELVAPVGFREEADCLSTHHYALTQPEGGDLSLLIRLVVVRRGRALQGRVRGGLVTRDGRPSGARDAGGGTGGKGPN